VQEGHVKGNANGTIASSLEAYFEAAAPNVPGANGGFIFNIYPPSAISLPENPVYKVAYDGIDSATGLPLFIGQVTAGSNQYTIGYADLYFQYNQLQATSEAYSPNSNCPSWPSQYFGTDGSGNYSSGNAMINEGNGFGWSEWTSAVSPYPDSGPYVYSLIHANSAFETYKSA
jgi:hypothetical protein